MNAFDIISLAERIVVRQDFNRQYALQCLNNVQLEVYRMFTQHKFFESKLLLEPIDGFVELLTLKSPEVVEYYKHTYRDNKKFILRKVISFDQILKMFGSASLEEPYTFGIPEFYMVVKEGIRLYPIPPEGKVSVMGEFFPDPLTDHISSRNILTDECGPALAYYTASYYFDLLTELDKAQYWRAKAQQDLDNYRDQARRQRTNNIPMMNRDPFGNLGYQEGVIPYTQWDVPNATDHRSATGHPLIKIDTVDGGAISNASYNSRAWERN